MCEICSKLTINTPEWSHWSRFGEILLIFVDFIQFFDVFIVNFEQVKVNCVKQKYTGISDFGDIQANACKSLTSGRFYKYFQSEYHMKFSDFLSRLFEVFYQTLTL